VTHHADALCLSISGSNQIDRTVSDAIAFSRINGFGEQLKLVPEQTAARLKEKGFVIHEMLDTHDYISATVALRDQRADWGSPKRRSKAQVKT
jgi:hypothetical protein